MFNPSRTRAAYDSVAGDYDRRLERDRWMRLALWRYFDRAFRPGDHVLDVGCGTGIDTLHLASRGIRVTALDVSPEMLCRLRTKLEAAGLSSRVDIHSGEACDVIRGLPGSFDGAISSFAALNSVDLSDFGQAVALRLRPRARAVFHMLSPRALRSYSHAGSTAVGSGPADPAASVSLDVRAPPLILRAPDAKDAYRRYFAGPFALRAECAFGFLVRGNLETVLPGGALNLLGRLEGYIGRRFRLSSVGRFFVLDLERRPS